jgi:hypothetical protein
MLMYDADALCNPGTTGFNLSFHEYRLLTARQFAQQHWISPIPLASDCISAHPRSQILEPIYKLPRRTRMTP